MSRIAVIGAGAWGTALAITGARSGCTVGLWAREPEVVEAIRRDRCNALFLPDHPVDEAVIATGDLAEAVAGAELALLVTPAQHLGVTAAQLAALPDCPPVVICAKGIDRASGRLLTEVVAEALPGHPQAVLSGPTFAGEVAQGLPAAVTVGARSDGWRRRPPRCWGRHASGYISPTIRSASRSAARSRMSSRLPAASSSAPGWARTRAPPSSPAAWPKPSAWRSPRAARRKPCPACRASAT